VSDDYQDYYYFLAAVGRKTESVAERLFALLLVVLPLPERLLLVIDDSPTKRYGPKVEGADVHHNPTPGPAGQPYLYGHIWVTISLALRHPSGGFLAAAALLYVREQRCKNSSSGTGNVCDQVATGGGWSNGGAAAKQRKNRVDRVDGGYTKRPFLQRAPGRARSSSDACADAAHATAARPQRGRG
jgi:hypothetical protein